MWYCQLQNATQSLISNSIKRVICIDILAFKHFIPSPPIIMWLTLSVNNIIMSSCVIFIRLQELSEYHVIYSEDWILESLEQAKKKR